MPSGSLSSQQVGHETFPVLPHKQPASRQIPGGLQTEPTAVAFFTVRRCIYSLSWDYPQLAKGKHGPSSQAKLGGSRDPLLGGKTATSFTWLCYFVYGLERTGQNYKRMKFLETGVGSYKEGRFLQSPTPA